MAVSLPNPVAIPKQNALSIGAEELEHYKFFTKFLDVRNKLILDAEQQILKIVSKYKENVLKEMQEIKHQETISAPKLFSSEMEKIFRDRLLQAQQVGTIKAKGMLGNNYYGFNKEELQLFYEWMLQEQLDQMKAQYINPVERLTKAYQEASDTNKPGIYSTLTNVLVNISALAPFTSSFLGSMSELPTALSISFFNQKLQKKEVTGSKNYLKWVGITDLKTCPDCLRYQNRVLDPTDFKAEKVTVPKQFINETIGVRCRGRCRCTLTPITEDEFRVAVGTKIIPFAPYYWSKMAEKFLTQVYKSPLATKLISGLPETLRVPQLWQGIAGVSFGTKWQTFPGFGVKSRIMDGLFKLKNDKFFIQLPQTLSTVKGWPVAQNFLVSRLCSALVKDSLSGSILSLEGTRYIMQKEREKLVEKLTAELIPVAQKKYGITTEFKSKVLAGILDRKTFTTFLNIPKYYDRILYGDLSFRDFFNAETRFTKMFTAYILNPAYFRTLPNAEVFHELIVGPILGPARVKSAVDRSLKMYYPGEMYKLDMTERDFLNLAKHWTEQYVGTSAEKEAYFKQIKTLMLQMYQVPALRSSFLWNRGIEPKTLKLLPTIDTLVYLSRDRAERLGAIGLRMSRVTDYPTMKTLSTDAWIKAIEKAGIHVHKFRFEDAKTVVATTISPEVFEHELIHAKYTWLPTKTAKEELFQIWRAYLLTYRTDFDTFQRLLPEAFQKVEPAILRKVEDTFRSIAKEYKFVDYIEKEALYENRLEMLFDSLEKIYTQAGIKNSLRTAVSARTKNLDEFFSINASKYLFTPINFFYREPGLSEVFDGFMKKWIFDKQPMMLSKFNMTYNEFLNKMRTELTGRQLYQWFRESLKELKGANVFYGIRSDS